MWLFYFMGIPSHVTCSYLTSIVIEIKEFPVQWYMELGRFFDFVTSFETFREMTSFVRNIDIFRAFQQISRLSLIQKKHQHEINLHNFGWVKTVV